MAEICVVVRQTAVNKRLQAVIEDCVTELNGSYGKLISRVTEPEFVDYKDGTTSRVAISEITYSYVHCVFQVKNRAIFPWQRKRALLFGVTEPEVIFSEDGEVHLSDIVCYTKSKHIKDVVEKRVLEFAQQFKISNVTFVLDSL